MGTYHAVRTVTHTHTHYPRTQTDTHTHTHTHTHATLAGILNEFSADCWNLQLLKKKKGSKHFWDQESSAL